MSGCAATGVVDATVPSGQAAASAALGSSLSLGDCVNGSADTLLANLTSVDCATPHDWEVYRVVNIPAGEYPGENEVAAAAESACAGAFEPFTGAPYERSTLDYTVVTPDVAAWAAGQHHADCLIGDPSGEVTNSLAGTKR